VILLNGLRSAVAGLGQGLGQLATQSAADHALAADGTAKTHHIPDGALTLGLLNQQNVDVKWLPGNISVPKSGDRTYLSISVGGDHIVTAANIIGCTYGLTVSTANDPIIGQDKLHGVGTYYEAPTEKQSYTCSTDSAPTSGWQPANSSQLKQISSPTSG
jgi:hypothetical protein